MGPEEELRQRELGSLNRTPSPVGAGGKGPVLEVLRPVAEGRGQRLRQGFGGAHSKASSQRLAVRLMGLTPTSTIA